MDYSLQNNDNFIRNCVTIALGGATSQRYQHAPARKVASSRELPVALQDIMRDLRVDASGEKDSVERMARAACAMIERRTGFVLIPGTYEVDMPGWWGGGLKIIRGPLRELTGVSYLDADGSRVEASAASFYAAGGDRWFEVTALSTFSRPALWSEIQNVRLTFEAGFAVPSEASADPAMPMLDDGLVTMMIMLTHHFYENRRLFEAGAMETLENGAQGLLGTYRTFW